MDVGSLIRQRISEAGQMMPTQAQAKGGGKDALAKENRAAYRKLLEASVAEGNTAQLNALSSQAVASGIDVSPYRVAAGQPAMDQKLQTAIDQTMAERLGMTEPGTPYRMEDDPAVGPAVNYGDTQQPPTPEGLKIKLNELFTDDFTQRLIAKQALGVDVGPNYGRTDEWFGRYREMREAYPNMPGSQIIESITMQEGWMPSEAANLKDLSPEEKEDMSETVFGNHFNDPVLRGGLAKMYPKADLDKIAAGFVLHGMRKEGYKVPDRFQPLLDRFDGLSDDMQDLEQSKKRAEIINQGLAQEEVDAKVWGGKLNRVAQEAQVKHNINKPRLSAAAIKQVSSAKTFNDLASDTMNVIASFYEADGLNAIPTGIGEMWRQYQDKYGVAADTNRIRLRTALANVTQMVYDMRGKQLAVPELELAMKEIPQMTDAPLQFVTKFSAFQRALKRGVESTIETYKKSGYDTSELEAFYDSLQGQPQLEAFLGMERPTVQKGKTERHKVPAPPAEKKAEPQERVVQGDPSDDKAYTAGKIYEDATGQKAKYLGGGKWQLLSQ